MWGLVAPRHRLHNPEINILTFLSALSQTPGDFQEDRVLESGVLIWETRRVSVNKQPFGVR